MLAVSATITDRLEWTKINNESSVFLNVLKNYGKVALFFEESNLPYLYYEKNW